uniref:Bet v I/Major latex protein domain-containing protein n=1 Tax=Araucaria cunninghamii TaxID=56994 RepID=A0A0D6QVZ4_ARACU
MVAGTITLDIESPLEAKRLWNATVKDGHNLLPKVAPEIVSGVTIVQGNGGVGTIKQVNFTPANKDFSYVKESVVEINEGNFVYAFTHVEGGELGKNLASVKFEFKFSPKVGGGCVITWTCHFDTLPGVAHDEAKAQELKNNATGLFKKIEAYLLSNPALYC